MRGISWLAANQLASQVSFLVFFFKSVQNILVWVKSDKNNGTSHEDRRTFFITSHSVLLRKRNVSDESCRENQCSVFFSPGNRSIYYITRKNIVQPDRPQMKIRRMRIACCVPKATNTHSGCVIIIAFPLQWLYEHTSVLRYTYIGCLVTSKVRKIL